MDLAGGHSGTLRSRATAFGWASSRSSTGSIESPRTDRASASVGTRSYCRVGARSVGRDSGSNQFWISRPSTCSKWRTLPVISIRDRLNAIAAIRRSGSSSGLPSDSSEARKDP